MLKRSTMIYTELSPNPNSMKFVLNYELVPEGLSFDYPDMPSTMEEDKASPLAADLFQFPFVQRVFIASNFITISKDDETQWETVIGDLRRFLKIFFDDENPVFAKETMDKNTLIIDANDSEAVGKIKAALDQYVRPAVESDGGAINFADYDEETGKVTVMLQGSCSGCPSATVTLKDGIERLLTTMVPGVKEVVAQAM
ncbi:MAG: NifU family protein [Cytophagales bacterium]|nr:NifU family protein [Cytophagales bacterium]